MNTYLTQTKHNTYRYYRRVPKPLLQYINSTSYFRVSLGSDITEATASALQFNQIIDETIQLISLGISETIVIDKLNLLLSQKKEVSSNKEGLFLDVVSNFLESKKGNVSNTDYEGSVYFYNEVCPTLFKKILSTSNPQLSKITYKHLLKFKEILQQLPKRNIQKYKSMELSVIVKSLSDIPSKDIISNNTVNKFIQRLRALFEFSLNLGLINNNFAKSIKLLSTSDDKLQRLPLSIVEIKELKSLLTTEKSYLCSCLFLSSMRLSEVYKCKVEEIEGIKCFTLLDRDIKLKTKSSYRVIPIHSSLLSQIDNFESYRESISSDNLAKSISKLIKKHNFKDSHKKSLYSLRHSFATELIQRGANNILVSQLMGHSLASQGGMTLSRYSSGYNIKQLQEVIEELPVC